MGLCLYICLGLFHLENEIGDATPICQYLIISSQVDSEAKLSFDCLEAYCHGIRCAIQLLMMMCCLGFARIN